MKSVVARLCQVTLAVGVCAGCSTARLSGDASYKVENRPGGFTISSTYSSYQFVPDSASAQAACKQSLMATAHDYAESFGRKIEPVNEQRIRISMGRNGLTGMTSCEASVAVVWAR